MSSIEKAIALLEVNPEPVSTKPHAPPTRRSVAGIKSERQLVTESSRHVDLDFEALASNGLLTPPTMQQSVLAEDYRLIKRALMLNAETLNGPYSKSYGNLVAVTSALKREGKTFTSFNLAMSIAAGWDTRALLVDCDFGDNSLTNLVGLTEAPGLTDVLLDPSVTLQDVIFRTNVPCLRFIPAGRDNSNVAELLGSERMERLVGELSTLWNDHVVLFDASALLTGAQAIMLTSMVGQVLFVANEGTTPQKAIQEAIALLDETKTVGLVLNKCRPSSSLKHH